MRTVDKLNQYLEFLCETLGHVNRHQGLMDYCSALMLPLERKSVEPLAATIDPYHVQSRHQSMHHFVSSSAWSDRHLLDRCWQWVDERLETQSARYWIVDDTGMPKKGKHSVGVAHQYCGQLGKQANCQVAVSLSVATEQGSLPVDYQLYLPESWAQDPQRRRVAGVPEQIEFATKPQLALQQIARACERGLTTNLVLADSGYGNNSEFRDGLYALNLPYTVGVQPNTSVLPANVKLLPPKAWSGRGRKPTRHRYAKGCEPRSCEQVAQELSENDWQFVEWREGTNETLSSWFAAVRVRVEHNDKTSDTLRPVQWLLVEWPEDEAEPSKYSLSTLPASTAIEELVHGAKMRWCIERDYQELKDELGLNHYEGRNWRGFHHHASLCIAAYAYLVAERLTKTTKSPKKNQSSCPKPSLPADYIPRGSPKSTAPC